MSYAYALPSYYTVRAKHKYPWPCASDPARTIELWPGDVLTKGKDGMTKHNGRMMVGIQVPTTDLKRKRKPVHMVVGGGF